MIESLKRCPWAEATTLEQIYHDEEWGKVVTDDRTLLEFLTLEGAQAGLSWRTILQKREGYRDAFAHFDAKKIAAYTSIDVERLMQNPNIVRNRLKIESTLSNAKAYLDILKRYGTFSGYIWQFVDGKPIQNRWKTLSEIPASTAESERMSKQLKKDGFRFVGPTICYAFMQAVGMVNDHLANCPYRFQESPRHFSQY